MNFFRDVVSHLIKNAFEGHTQFSVADNTAVGDNPIRSISLDAVPLDDNTMISLAWEGGEKLFEKTLSEQEAQHQFSLISSDLAEVASLTKQGQYDAAKDLMKKLGQKYAENTGELVQTNLPPLHNTQASLDKQASTDYYFTPISLNKLKKIPGIKIGKGSEGGIVATDGENYVHLNVDDKGLVDSFTRFGANDPSGIIDAFSVIVGNIMDEHEMQDIWAEEDEKAHNAPGHVCDEQCPFFEYEEDVKNIVDEYAKMPTPAPAKKPVKKQPKRRSSRNSDDRIWKEAKITMQNLWFSTTDELLDYQQKQKGAVKPGDQDHIPLWDKNKQKAPANDKLAPASLSYEDLEDKKEQEHEDMQNHIDEKIKTELESALQQKAASVFGPDQVELVNVLRKNGRNWDEIKKILVKDFGFDKDSTNIFVDEQRQGTDPTGIEVEPVKEDDKEKAPLTPPEELVSPETHDQLLKDHEDKKKDNSPVEEPNFTPKEIMDIPEDEEIHDESSLVDEIARADNDEIHKVASEKCKCGHSHDGDVCDDCKCTIHNTASKKTAGPSDLNPLQEPIQEEPTTPQQDVVPMGKKPLDHATPQKGDRVFVASDMSDEKAGFEGTFVSTYKTQGRDQYIVETDQGDLLDVDAHRVSKISDNGGAQDTEPVMEPVIETPKEEPIPVTPKMSDFHSSLDTEALSIKAELDDMLKIVKEADSHVIMPMMYGVDDESVLQYANGSIFADKIKSGQMQDKDWESLIRETGRWMTHVGRQKVSQTFPPEAEWFLDEEQINKLKSMFNALPKDNPNEPPPVESESSMVNWTCPKCGNEASASSVYDEKICMKDGCGSTMNKKAYEGFEHTLTDPKGPMKQAADPVEPGKTQYKDYKITPKYTPKEEAVPATPELDAVLSKMDALQQNLATLETTRKQIQAKMQEEMNKVDQSGERVQMEAELQESIEKAAILISAVESKVVQWKDKLFTLQTEEVQYVPKLSQKELLAKIYEKFSGAEKYVKDVLNGMLSQAKPGTENTLVRWPNKKSSVNKEATILDDMNHYNEELMAALQALSSPI